MELMTMGSEAPAAGLSWGLVVAALLLGLRHGIDWDHIAAITDMTATEDSPRRGFRLGAMYVLGHAAAVLALGSVIIFAGLSLPDWVDVLMGKVVGVTLVALGVYVVVSLVRDKGQFRPRSRWMVLIGFVRSLRSRLHRRTVNLSLHHHRHAAVRGLHHQSDEAGGVETVAEGPLRTPVHSHSHTHPNESSDLGARTAAGIGALHGFGAETPTQVVLFLAAAGAGGTSAGLVVLVVFLVGLVASNTSITLMTTFGFQRVADRARLYMVMGAVTAALSLVVGTTLLAGQETVLEALMG